MIRMGVDLRRAQVHMPQKLLNHPNGARLHKSRCEGVSQNVRVDRFIEGLEPGLFDDSLDLASGDWTKRIRAVEHPERVGRRLPAGGIFRVTNNRSLDSAGQGNRAFPLLFGDFSADRERVNRLRVKPEVSDKELHNFTYSQTSIQHKETDKVVP